MMAFVGQRVEKDLGPGSGKGARVAPGKPDDAMLLGYVEISIPPRDPVGDA